MLYVYLGFPFLLLILSKIKPDRVKKKEFFPTVSLIISVCNEEDIIEQKIKNTLELDYPKELLEIIVASESNDRTNEIVKKYERSGIKLIAFSNREGKAATLFKIVPVSKGDILLFSDANAIYDKLAIKKIARNFNDEKVGCVGGRMQYLNPAASISGKGEMTFWDYENFLKKMSSGAVAGSIFALRREAYLPLNKYRGDDFELSIRAAINGYKVVYEEEALSYEEVYETTKKEYKKKVRVISWNLESALMLFPEALKKKRFFIAFKILSHRILRWLVPFFLIALFVSNLVLVFNNDGSVFKYFFWSQIFLYLSALVGFIIDRFSKLKRANIFWLPYFFCLVNYAALIGTSKTLFRKTGTLWEVER